MTDETLQSDAPGRDDLPEHLRFAGYVTGLEPFARYDVGSAEFDAMRDAGEHYLQSLTPRERIELLREEYWLTVSLNIAQYARLLSADTDRLDADDTAALDRIRDETRDGLRRAFDGRDAMPRERQGPFQRYALELLRMMFDATDDAGGVTFTDEECEFLRHFRWSLADEADAAESRKC